MATIDLSDDEVKTLKDMITMVRPLMSNVSSSQIVASTASIGQLMPVLQALATPRIIYLLSKTGDDIADMLDLIITYQRSGVIKKGLELIAFVCALREAFSTPAVAHMAVSANEFLLTGNQLLSEIERFGGVKGLVAAAKEASLEAEHDQRTIGVVGLLRALKEPDVQRAAKFLLHFLKALGKGS